MRRLLIACLALVASINTFAGGSIGGTIGGNDGSKIESLIMQEFMESELSLPVQVLELPVFHNKVERNDFSFRGVGGAAGGNNDTGFRTTRKNHHNKIIFGETTFHIEEDQKSVYLKIQDISEFTLKDGTVIRAEELLENLQK